MSRIAPAIKSDITPEPRPHLSVELKHRVGALEIAAAFELTQPWTVLFGPSGSGKSTILRSIAGLLRPDSARIVVHNKGGEQVAVDTAKKIWIPAHRRLVRWAAQRPALFPNMTVRENLSFVAVGLDKNRAVGTLIDQFHLNAFADRRPAMLSGGEQQRASLARTICSANGNVGLLLLDEPFSGLDNLLRDELLESLRGWLASSRIPVLSVTHDAGEAFLLNAEIIRLQEGRITQQGPVAEVLAVERARLLRQLDPSSTDLSRPA